MNHLRSYKIFEKFTNPPPDIKEKLDNIVSNLLSRYKGKEFFNKLDHSIKDITNQDMILSLVSGNEDEYIISSGGFGDELYDLYRSGKFKCKGLVVFNGGMVTQNKGVTGYYPIDFDIDNKEFIFVDDSLFSGGTANKISNYISKFNSSIKSIQVIYDGSKIKLPNVYSFFRYYE